MVDCEKSSNFARMNLQMFRYITLSVVLTAALTLLSACSNSDDAPANPTAPTAEDNSIRFNANVWRMMDAAPRRATTYDNQAALQGAGTFTCVVYNKNTTTEYVPATSVNWVTDKWAFSDGKHYWPASGALDFFAYLPAAGSLPSYISAGPTYSYSSSHEMTFTCTNLPMTNAGQGSSLKEFVYAMALDQDKAGTNSTLQPTPGQVALTFQHPFAKIKLQLSASHPDIQINSITFKGIKNNGSFSNTGSPNKWTTSGDATNLVLTFTGSDATFVGNASSAPLTQIGPTFLMIPQAWAGAIEINATWTDWGEQIAHTLTASVPTTWQPGYSYTYTFTITEFDLRVSTSKYTEQW